MAKRKTTAAPVSGDGYAMHIYSVPSKLKEFSGKTLRKCKNCGETFEGIYKCCSKECAEVIVKENIKRQKRVFNKRFFSKKKG